MKKIAFLLLVLLFVASYSIQAQKQFIGEIHFQTKIEGTNDPNIISSIENMTSVISILGNKTKVVENFEGMYSVTIVSDGDKGATIFIIEIMGMGKYYKKTTAEEIKDKLKNSNFSYSYENEYKEICGYKCQKVVATITNLEDDSTTEAIYYVTKEIGGNKINSTQTPGLEGFPLLTLQPLTQYCEACMLAMEAIKITPKKIKEVDFLLPDDAKNIDDEPQIKAMLGLE
jgi:hypothetical protein